MNDIEKTDLRRANDNPWYCLATLYGEQPAQGAWDRDLAAKNRAAWNRWTTGVLSDEQRANLVKNGFSESELLPLTSAEKSAFCIAFVSRSGREGEVPPNPAEVADFTRTDFDRVVIFGGFLYAVDASFSHARFSERADFGRALFFGHADFGSATFSGFAHFLSATFSGSADFRSVTFSERADFRYATFSDFAHFLSAKFSGSADFRSATFSLSANFGSATFSGETSFLSATFFERVTFHSTAFSERVDFRYATFSGYADFLSTMFSESADFASATFLVRANFINAQFADNTVFAHVDFRTNVPDFRGAKMHEATEWHGANWPLAPRDRDTAQAQVYAYERLKKEMEQLKKHEDEQFFFHNELRARRRLCRLGSGTWLLNYVYEASSDYGQSIRRPFLWIFGLFAVGSFVFAGFPVFKGTRLTISQATALSFANIFSFLPIKREIMTADMVTGLSSAAQIIGAAQSLLGAVLLFLLGLALRGRFRMR
jgi:hypothetical protein